MIPPRESSEAVGTLGREEKEKSIGLLYTPCFTKEWGDVTIVKVSIKLATLLKSMGSREFTISAHVCKFAISFFFFFALQCSDKTASKVMLN